MKNRTRIVRASIFSLTSIALGSCVPFIEGNSEGWATNEARAVHADLQSNIGYYDNAVAAINSRHYALALEYLQAARHQRPDDVRVLTAFGVVYDKLGRFDLSARYYSQATALDPKSQIIAADMDYSRKLQGILAPNAAPMVADAGSNIAGETTPRTVAGVLKSDEALLAAAANRNLAPAQAASVDSNPRSAAPNADNSRGSQSTPNLNIAPTNDAGGPAQRTAAADLNGGKVPSVVAASLTASGSHLPATSLESERGIADSRGDHFRELQSISTHESESTVLDWGSNMTGVSSNGALALPVVVTMQNPRAAALLDTNSRIDASDLDSTPKLQMVLAPDATPAVSTSSNIASGSTLRTKLETGGEVFLSAAPESMFGARLLAGPNHVTVDNKNAAQAKFDLLKTTKFVFLTGHPLTIVDASGRSGTDKSVRSYLSGLHWSIGRTESMKAQAQRQTAIVYKEGMATAAKALARTLSLQIPVHLKSNNNVEGLQLILGSDLSGTNLAGTSGVAQPHHRQFALAAADEKKRE